MASRIQVSALILMVTGLWALLLLLSGTTVEVSWFRHLSAITGAVVLALTAFDLWLWRLPVFRGWFVHRPVVRGTWRVEIRSAWKDPTTGQPVPVVKGFARVRQTYSLLQLRIMTAESSSDLLGSEMVRGTDGTFLVTGVYRNEPRLSVRPRSPIHYGAVLLYVPENLPKKIEGQYWTDRESQGEMTLSDRVPQLMSSHDAAEEAYGKRQPLQEA